MMFCDDVNDDVFFVVVSRSYVKSEMEVSQYNGLEINHTRDDNGGLKELKINQIVQLKQLINDLSKKFDIPEIQQHSTIIRALVFQNIII